MLQTKLIQTQLRHMKAAIKYAVKCGYLKFRFDHAGNILTMAFELPDHLKCYPAQFHPYRIYEFWFGGGHLGISTIGFVVQRRH